MDPVQAGVSAEKENYANRKLIRPTLMRSENHGNHNGSPMPLQERRERPERHDRAERPMGGGGKKSSPPEQTNAENFYYQKQMQSKTPVVVVLKDGEQVTGLIEWYDKNCIKLNRHGASNLLLYKPSIRYMYKAGEARQP